MSRHYPPESCAKHVYDIIVNNKKIDDKLLTTGNYIKNIQYPIEFLRQISLYYFSYDSRHIVEKLKLFHIYKIWFDHYKHDPLYYRLIARLANVSTNVEFMKTIVNKSSPFELRFACASGFYWRKFGLIIKYFGKIITDEEKKYIKYDLHISSEIQNALISPKHFGLKGGMLYVETMADDTIKTTKCQEYIDYNQKMKQTYDLIKVKGVVSML